jgi:TRAP-type C4-dicarboxylate transport system permease small subunit
MKQIGLLIGKLSHGLDRAMIGTVFLLVAAMVIVTTLQVVFRVFFNALTWSEELSRYLLVWGTFFGATLAYKRGNHIAVTFVVDLLPGRVRTAFLILSYLLSMVFFIVIAVQGMKMIQMQVFQISPAMSLPMKHVYLSIPVSLLIMTIHALAGMFETFYAEEEKRGAAK